MSKKCPACQQDLSPGNDACNFQECPTNQEHPYRLNISIDLDAASFEDALERGLDLLMQAPSMRVDVWNLRTKETKLMESSPDKAAETYGEG